MSWTPGAKHKLLLEKMTDQVQQGLLVVDKVLEKVESQNVNSLGLIQLEQSK